MRWLFSKLSSECQSTPDDEEAKWGALAHCSAPQIGASSEIDEPPQRPPAFGSNDVLKTRAVPAELFSSSTGVPAGAGQALPPLHTFDSDPFLSGNLPPILTLALGPGTPPRRGPPLGSCRPRCARC